MSQIQEFNDYRAKMNERLLAHDNKTLKRFFSLDGAAYEEGALPTKTKEMLGGQISWVAGATNEASFMDYYLAQ